MRAVSLRQESYSERTVFLPFFSVCRSFFVKPGTKAPVSRLHFIFVAQGSESMIIFIEILSIEVTIRFSTQVNGKKKEKGEGG